MPANIKKNLIKQNIPHVLKNPKLYKKYGILKVSGSKKYNILKINKSIPFTYLIINLHNLL